MEQCCIRAPVRRSTRRLAILVLVITNLCKNQCVRHSWWATFAHEMGPLQSSKMFLSWPAEVAVGTALAFHTAGAMEEGTWCALPPGVTHGSCVWHKPLCLCTVCTLCTVCRGHVLDAAYWNCHPALCRWLKGCRLA